MGVALLPIVRICPAAALGDGLHKAKRHLFKISQKSRRRLVVKVARNDSGGVRAYSIENGLVYAAYFGESEWYESLVALPRALLAFQMQRERAPFHAAAFKLRAKRAARRHPVFALHLYFDAAEIHEAPRPYLRHYREP